MRSAIPLAALAAAALVACKPPLTPTEKAAKDRSECMVVAIDQSGFDPITAEEPPRTVSTTRESGGTTQEGDAAGGLIGGARHQKSGELMTTMQPNPAYQEYVAKKAAYKSALDQCLAARAGAPQ